MNVVNSEQIRAGLLAINPELTELQISDLSDLVWDVLSCETFMAESDGDVEDAICHALCGISSHLAGFGWSFESSGDLFREMGNGLNRTIRLYDKSVPSVSTCNEMNAATGEVRNG